MKICITSDGKDLESNVDPRFGRCAYFIFYDTDTGKFDAVSNDNASGMGGVGIQNGQLMAEKGVELVLTGNLGPNASGVLQQAGIKSITGVRGKVKDALEDYKKGILKEGAAGSGPTVPSHFGMGKKKQ
ncbi:MAG TPA: NifB/NifX family molybdenum-iron cluster-binding protein [bacterium]|nr:NifB/NifX family molybdenum-iron cluster-binding protein [bacterium]